MEKKAKLMNIVRAMKMNNININVDENSSEKEIYNAILLSGNDKYGILATRVVENNPMASMVF